MHTLSLGHKVVLHCIVPDRITSETVRACVRACVRVCVCVCSVRESWGRQRERETETERQTETDRERERMIHSLGTVITN